MCYNVLRRQKLVLHCVTSKKNGKSTNLTKIFWHFYKKNQIKKLLQAEKSGNTKVRSFSVFQTIFAKIVILIGSPNQSCDGLEVNLMQSLYSELLAPIIVGMVLALFTYWLDNRNK